MPRMLTLALVALLPTIWIVDANNGPGTNFTDLPAAVAAAQNGDTLLVRAGVYTAFVVSGKALTIRGEGTAATVVQHPVPLPSDYRMTTFETTPPGQTCYLAGIRFAPTASFFEPALKVRSDARLVAMDCEFTHLLGGPLASGVLVQGELHAQRCSIRGGDGLFNGAVTGGLGAAGVDVTGSGRFAADACTLQGGTGVGGSPFGALVPPTGGIGLLLQQSAIATVAGCNLRGGNAGPPGPFGQPSVGGLGVYAGGTSFLRLAGTAAHEVRGGTSVSGTHTPAMQLDNQGAIVHGAIQLLASTPGGPTISGSGAALVVARPARPAFALTATLLPSGAVDATAPVTIDLDGTRPNQVWLFVLSTTPEFLAGLAPIAEGELLVSLASSVSWAGLLDAAGLASFAFTPAAFGPLDVPLHAQAVTLDFATGEILLSSADVRVYTP